MFQRWRDEIKEAIALDDAHRQSYERWQARQAAREAAQGEPEPEIIYKTYEPTAKLRATTMDSETEARWNVWCRAVIATELAEQEPFTKTQSEIIARAFAMLREELREEFNREVGLLSGPHTANRNH